MEKRRQAAYSSFAIASTSSWSMPHLSPSTPNAPTTGAEYMSGLATHCTRASIARAASSSAASVTAIRHVHPTALCAAGEPPCSIAEMSCFESASSAPGASRDHLGLKSVSSST